MKTYRIYTQDINRDEVIKIISKEFESFTLFNGTGYWQSEQENSLVIEIIGRYEDRKRITAIANEIKQVNKQQSVLITGTDNEAIFI
jgi:capsular polysaccharide biosynthesis protein